MPAKASGTTLKSFVKSCMGTDKNGFSNQDNILNRNHKGQNSSDQFLRTGLTDSFRLPTLVASHMYNKELLIDLIKQTITKSLIIYIHQEDTDRLRLAIHQIAHARICRNQKTSECQADEDNLVQIIQQSGRDGGLLLLLPPLL